MVKVKDTCSKLSFIFPRDLPRHSLMVLGNWTETPEQHQFCSSSKFQVQKLVSWAQVDFSPLGEGKASTKFPFSSLLFSVENFPWICWGTDPFFYFTQHNLIGLYPKRKGFSLLLRYPAPLCWYPDPQQLQAWMLVLNAKVSFFFLSISILPASCLV